MSDMIERVAKAIYEANPYQDQETDLDGWPLGPVYSVPWDTINEFDSVCGRDYFLNLARAAIDAMPDLQKLQEFAAWVETWVSNPVGAYSVYALDGLFAMTRDRLAALSQDTHSLPSEDR